MSESYNDIDSLLSHRPNFLFYIFNLILLIMINWLSVILNAIWILGAALALAVLSIAYYQSWQGGGKLGAVLNTSQYAIPLNIAGGLFALGMGLTSERWWEIVLWMILVGLFCYQGIKKY